MQRFRNCPHTLSPIQSQVTSQIRESDPLSVPQPDSSLCPGIFPSQNSSHCSIAHWWRCSNASICSIPRAGVSIRAICASHYGTCVRDSYARRVDTRPKKPRLLGGADERDNYTLLCNPCNRLKSNKLTLTELRDVRVNEGRIDAKWWARRGGSKETKLGPSRGGFSLECHRSAAGRVPADPDTRPSQRKVQQLTPEGL